MTAIEKTLTERDSFESEAGPLGWSVNHDKETTSFDLDNGWSIVSGWSDNGVPTSYVVMDPGGFVRDTRNWQCEKEGVRAGLREWLKASSSLNSESGPASSPDAAVQQAADRIVSLVSDALANALGKPSSLERQVLCYADELDSVEPSPVLPRDVAKILRLLVKEAQR